MQETKRLIALGQKFADKYDDKAPDTLRSKQLDPELAKIKTSIAEIKELTKELEDAFIDSRIYSTGPISKHLTFVNYYGTLLALNSAKNKLKMAIKGLSKSEIPIIGDL